MQAQRCDPLIWIMIWIMVGEEEETETETKGHKKNARNRGCA
jgi:hypothetical protein